MSALHSPPLAERLDDDATTLTLDAVAHACRKDAAWVLARLQEGLLQASGNAAADTPAAWGFTGTAVVRARRLAHLEVTFDADPQLAALTVDLIEEVLVLRQQLRHWAAR